MISGLWPMLFHGREFGLTTWIWLALWAPAAGSMAAWLSRAAFAWTVPVVWGFALVLIGTGASHPAIGTLAVGALYLLGLATGSRKCCSWTGVGMWLLSATMLSAIPTAAGVWVSVPPADWLALVLDLSPVVWVTEHAGYDWMRHISVYERAGAGDLGPDLRMAWSSATAPGVLSSLLGGWVFVRRARVRNTATAADR